MSRKLFVFAFFLLFTILLCSPALSASSCGSNMTWSLSDAGILTISGRGSSYNFSSHGAPWYHQRDRITGVVIEGSVDYLGTYFLEDCNSLVSIDLGSVSGFGRNFLVNCPAVTELFIPGDVETWADPIISRCENLTVFVTKEGYPVFSALRYAGIPFVVTDADSDFVIEDNILVGYAGNAVKLIIPEGVQELGNYACAYLRNTEEVVLPESVRIFRDSVFEHCPNLVSVQMPGSMTEFGTSVFSECTNLNKITVPEGIRILPTGAFSRCSGLKTVYLPASLSSVQMSVFVGCSALEKVIYAGTEDSRSRISFGRYNDPAVNCEWVYSENDPPDIVITNDLNEVYAGQKIKVSFVKVGTGISIQQAAWIESSVDESIIRTPCPVSDLTEGVVSFVPDIEGHSWLEISYLDPDGTLKTISGVPVKVNGLVPLNAPQNPHWESLIAKWNPVDNAAGYETVCEVYRNASRLTEYTDIINRPERDMGDVISRLISDDQVTGGIIRLKYSVRALAPDDPSSGLANSADSGCSVELPYDITNNTIVYWLDARYTWNEDGTSVTAERSFFDGSQTESETVATHRELVSAPTQESPGSYRIISFPFSNPAFEIQVKADESCVIPPLSEMNVLFLPESTAEIWGSAFAGISADAVILPESCQSIGSKAFANCKKLLYVHIPANTVVAGDAFDESPKVVLDSSR